MKERRLQRIILMFVSVLMVLTLTAAGNKSSYGPGTMVYIAPWKAIKEYTIEANESARIRWGWTACSKGLVQDYVDSIRITYRLIDEQGNVVGVYEVNPSAWGDYRNTSFSWSPKECYYPAADTWGKWYESITLNLSTPGTYTLVSNGELLFSVIDGADHYNNYPNNYFAAGPTMNNTRTIIKK